MIHISALMRFDIFDVCLLLLLHAAANSRKQNEQRRAEEEEEAREFHFSYFDYCSYFFLTHLFLLIAFNLTNFSIAKRC